MRLKELILNKRNAIISISKHHGAHNVRIFGSVVRDEAGHESDIDFLVELEKGRSLLDLGGLLMDLQDLLGRKVDVVTEKGLHWYVKDKILEEAQPV